MNKWYMLTLVGEDRPGIVARLTQVLFEGGCNLGEASMMRLGGNFTIMVMVQAAAEETTLERLVSPLGEELGVRIHIDPIKGQLHRHQQPDVRITVHGADRAGIVARVTGALAEAGLNILDLESDVGGSEESPLYLLLIEGQALHGIEPLRAALRRVGDDGIEVAITPIDTLVG